MAQSLSRLWTHLIFSTKNRFPFLSEKTIRTDMHRYLGQMLRHQNCETLIVNGVEDHVHVNANTKGVRYSNTEGVR